MRKYFQTAIAVISVILVIGIVLMFYLFASGNSGNMGLVMLVLDLLAAGCLAAIIVLKRRKDKLEDIIVECPACKSKEIERLAGITHISQTEDAKNLEQGKSHEYHCSSCGNMWRRKI